MNVPRPPSALSSTQPEVIIRNDDTENVNLFLFPQDINFDYPFCVPQNH